MPGWEIFHVKAAEPKYGDRFGLLLVSSMSWFSERTVCGSFVGVWHGGERSGGGGARRMLPRASLTAVQSAGGGVVGWDGRVLGASY